MYSARLSELSPKCWFRPSVGVTIRQMAISPNRNVAELTYNAEWMM